MKIETLRKIVLFQLALITIIQTSNMYIIIPNYNLIREDLGVSDFFLGSMTGAYIFLSGISSAAWSYLTEHLRLRRKWLLTLSLLMAGGFTYLASLATNPVILFLLRILTGVFLGAVFPLSYEIIADFYENDRRTLAYMVWYIVSGIGMALGFGMSVILAFLFSWRYPIYVNSMMLIFIGSPIAALLVEPKRALGDILSIYGSHEGLEYMYRFRLSDLKLVLTNKTNIYVAVEEFVSTLPQGVLIAWLTQYVVRELGSPEIVAMIFLGLGMLGGLFGVFIAKLADFLYSHNPRFRPLIAAISASIQTIFLIIFLSLPIKLNIVGEDPIVAVLRFFSLMKENMLILFAVIVFFLGMVFNSSIEPIKNSVLSDVNLPEQRAIVVSAISTMELFFRSAGIAVAGLISDVTGSIRLTLMIFVMLYVFSGFLWVRAAETYSRDLLRIRSIVKSKIRNVNDNIDN